MFRSIRKKMLVSNNIKSRYIKKKGRFKYIFNKKSALYFNFIDK